MDAKLCEMCDATYADADEVRGGRRGLSGFCSDDCKSDAATEIFAADGDARREFSAYGNDFDSWYR